METIFSKYVVQEVCCCTMILRYMFYHLGCPVWNRESDSMTHVDPFQLRILHNSVIELAGNSQLIFSGVVSLSSQ